MMVTSGGKILKENDTKDKGSILKISDLLKEHAGTILTLASILTLGITFGNYQAEQVNTLANLTDKVSDLGKAVEKMNSVSLAIEELETDVDSLELQLEAIMVDWVGGIIVENEPTNFAYFSRRDKNGTNMVCKIPEYRMHLAKEIGTELVDKACLAAKQ